MPQAILCVAPLLMLSVVRASAAVAGMPPAIPHAMFAKPRPNISLFLLCFVFVIPSAMRADIIVSIIEMRAIVRAGSSNLAANRYEVGNSRRG